MPAYADKTRTALLAMAAQLVPLARDLCTDPSVIDAAREAEAAALDLELLIADRHSVSRAFAGHASGVSAAEDSLDRRVGALSRLVSALADFGVAEAEGLALDLFPDGLEAVIRPTGRAQVPLYVQLAERLGVAATRPVAARLEPELSALREDLLSFCSTTQARESSRASVASVLVQAAAATETLRRALTRLDREVERAADGVRGELYQRWAASVRGVR